MKSNIAINLKKLMTLANISESELSRRTNIKQPIIHRLLSGENINPKLMTLKPIADYFLLSVSELIGEREISHLWKGATSKDHKGWQKVAVRNWLKVSKIRKYDIQQFVITECNLSKNAFGMYISDQSMEPVFPESSIAIIEPNLAPKNGNYVLIITDSDEELIRSFIESSGKMYITPLNYKFGIIRELEDKAQIAGVVIRTIYDHVSI